MRSGDAGFAMLWALALTGVLVMVGGAGLSLAGLAMAHARAGNAADLAAIAAVSDLRDPCGSASRIAEAHHAALIDCTLTEGDVIVRVRVIAPTMTRWLGSDRLEVIARAGPATN